MANKLDSLLDAIETKLGDLVGTGVLKAVCRRIITPLTEVRLPICALLPSAAFRQGGEAATGDWEATALLMVCTRAKDTKADQSISDIMAEISAKLDALNDSDSPGGSIDMPRWDFWYALGTANVPVGAMASLRLQFTGALKTP